MSLSKWIVCVAGLAGILVAGAPAAKATKPGDPAFAITNVRVFDGEQVIEGATVVIVGRQVAYVGVNDKNQVPADAAIIDGSGATLMPGLIDSHVHDWGYGVDRAPI